jgi:hypothetical protein
MVLNDAGQWKSEVRVIKGPAGDWHRAPSARDRSESSLILRLYVYLTSCDILRTIGLNRAPAPGP